MKLASVDMHTVDVVRIQSEIFLFISEHQQNEKEEQKYIGLFVQWSIHDIGSNCILSTCFQ